MHLNEKARQDKLSAARELVRSATLEGDGDLLQALENALSACEFQSPYADRLRELCSDMDYLRWAPESELSALPYSGKEKGQFDTFTKNVRHRHD